MARAVTWRLVPPSLALLLLLLAGCGSPPPPGEGGSGTAGSVVAADGVLCDLTRTLAGPDLTVDCLLAPGEDPHALRLTPDQKRRLQQARLVLINGYGLSPALERLSGAEAVAEAAVPQALRLDGAAHGGESPHAEAHAHGEEPHPDGEAHAHGEEPHADGEAHAHGDRDPHVWHDPANAAAMVHWIARRLERLEPSHRAAIAGRAAAMEAVLGDLDRWNRRQLATVPRPGPGQRLALATGHRAFASLAAAYGLEELSVVDAHSRAETLRPEGLREAVDELRRRRVRSLFSETLPPPRSLQRIADLAGIPVAPAPLIADGLAPAGSGDGRGGGGVGATLPGTLTANTCTIVTALGGHCDRAGGEALVRRWRAITGTDRPG